MASLFLPFMLVYGLSNVLADPCAEYIIGNAAGRGSDLPFDINRIQGCDITLKKGWYRFKLSGQDADMPTEAPNFGACGSYYPVYLQGSLPTVQEQTVTRRTCYRSFTACVPGVNIKVKNCGTFNVYELVSVPLCPAQYCFDVAALAGPCPQGQSSETGLYPGCSANFPDIDVTPSVEPRLGVNPNNPIAQDLRFQCKFNDNGQNLFYDIVWYINGDEVARIKGLTFTDVTQSGELLESHWTDNYKLGVEVKCAVRARFASSGTPSPEHESLSFFAGIKFVDGTTVDVRQGETKSVRFRSTVPIPCSTVFPCILTLNVLKAGPDANGGCSGGELVDTCSVQISPNQWEAVHDFHVTGQFRSTYGNQVAQLLLRVTSKIPGLPTVWDDVETQPVHVNIHNEDAQVEGRSCKIFNDPHFITFDNKRFDVHIHGEFVLYRHRILPFEVRGFFEQCSPTSVAHCVCGGAVRSGTQYFVWSNCRDSMYDGNIAYQTTRINMYGCNSRQMRVTTDQNGFTYKIKTPSSLEVIFDTRYRRIAIYPSAADIGQTTGLCGNFNGDPNDEFIDPTGRQHSNECERYLFGSPSVFCMVPTYSLTWKITNPQESLYNGNLAGTIGDPIAAHCYCSDPVLGTVTCDVMPPEGCNVAQLSDDVTDTYCTQLVNKRKKRSTDLTGSVDPVPVFPVESPNPPPPLTDGWPNGWTKEKAESFCRSVFDSSNVVAACQQVPNLKTELMIESCIADIALTGNTDWAPATLEAQKSDCIEEVYKNTSLQVPKGGNPSVLDTVLLISCPGECSGKGECVQGSCVCNEPWTGPDCNVDENEGPNVFSVEFDTFCEFNETDCSLEFGGSCELNETDCNVTIVRGVNFVNLPTLTCRFGDYSVGRYLFSTAVFRHSSEVLCPLPDEARRNPAVGYRVSVSNNNKIFGSGALLLIFGSPWTTTMPNSTDFGVG